MSCPSQNLYFLQMSGFTLLQIQAELRGVPAAEPPPSRPAPGPERTDQHLLPATSDIWQYTMAADTCDTCRTIQHNRCRRHRRACGCIRRSKHLPKQWTRSIKWSIDSMYYHHPSKNHLGRAFEQPLIVGKLAMQPLKVAF